MRPPPHLLTLTLLLAVTATVPLSFAVCVLRQEGSESKSEATAAAGSSIKALSIDEFGTPTKKVVEKPKENPYEETASAKGASTADGKPAGEAEAASGTSPAPAAKPDKVKKEKSDGSDASAYLKKKKKEKKEKDELDGSASPKKEKKEKSDDSDASADLKKEKKKKKSDDSDDKKEKKKEKSDGLDVSASPKKEKKEKSGDSDESSSPKKKKKEKSDGSDSDKDASAKKEKKEKSSVDANASAYFKKEKKENAKKKEKSDEDATPADVSQEEKADEDAAPVDVSDSGQYVSSPTKAESKAKTATTSSVEQATLSKSSAITPDALAASKHAVSQQQPMGGAPDELPPTAKSSTTTDAYTSPDANPEPVMGGSPDELPPGAKSSATPNEPAPAQPPPMSIGGMIKKPIIKMLSPVIKRVCAKTEYPEDCEASIAGLPGGAPPQVDAVGVLRLAIEAVRAKAIEAMKVATDRMNAPGTDATTKEALDSCTTSYSDIRASLDTVDEALDRGDVDTARTNLDSVETDVVTCDDGFNERGTPSVMTDHDQELQKLASDLIAIGADTVPK